MVALLAVMSLGSACASTGPTRLPRQRYYDALDKRLSGDVKGYYDDIIALAHDAPDSRAGRRARAMLQGADLYTIATIGGVLAAIAIPNFMKYQNRARQTEAQTQLRGIDVAQQAYRQRHGVWCQDPNACRLGDFAGTHYIYFLTDSIIRGGDQADDKGLLITRARVAMKALGVEARMAEDGFLAIAVGDLDGDPDLDIWIIDEAGGPFQLANDLDSKESGGGPFGL